MFHDINCELIIDDLVHRIKTPDGHIRRLYDFGGQFYGEYVRYNGRKYQVNIHRDTITADFFLEFPNELF